MKKWILVLMVLAAGPAMAIAYYLESSWTNKSGDTMCKYSDGTVLNMGYKTCPTKIEK